jgi:hypothetical protein
MTCGQSHPMQIHGDLKCGRPEAHEGSHEAPTGYYGDCGKIRWTRSPTDTCVPPKSGVLIPREE